MPNAAPTLSVVVPVYCEEALVERFVARLTGVLAETGVPFEVVVVDDGSTDETWGALRRAAVPQLRAIRLSRNFGKEAALSAGLVAARGDAVVVMDGDLQHPPELIPEMIRLWSKAGAEVVEAVKERHERESRLGRLRARAFYLLLDRLSGYDLRGASDFKLLDRRVVEAWRGMGERALFFRGMITWLGFRHASVPFSVPPRDGGRSKWTPLQLARLAANAVTSFSSFPLQVVTLLGFLFMGFSLVLGAQTLYQKYLGHAVDGFTTVILLLLIIGSLLMISLGVIGAYVARIFEEVKGRPRYVVSEVLGQGAEAAGGAAKDSRPVALAASGEAPEGAANEAPEDAAEAGAPPAAPAARRPIPHPFPR